MTSSFLCLSWRRCRETLRHYPPAPGAMRTTRRDVVLPLSALIQGVDGRKVHEIFVPKNTNVFAQIYNLNGDPSIWGTDAAEWKPERSFFPSFTQVERGNKLRYPIGGEETENRFRSHLNRVTKIMTCAASAPASNIQKEASI